MPNILPITPLHLHKYKPYFMPCIIKLHPKYQHIAQTLAPLLKPSHQNHQTQLNIYPHLQIYITQHSIYTAPRILFRLNHNYSPQHSTLQPHTIHQLQSLRSHHTPYNLIQILKPPKTPRTTLPPIYPIPLHPQRYHHTAHLYT